ncbi:TPA: hypothetical protein UME25_003188 [Stenotrophomonas maltophilia]|uniref:hypothetical protein n=1 Tax=Stenotrophomonas sp. Sm6012 TaxID=3002745 RepID=UPI0013133C0B|nr:hypothetical protein [Stenotrophomonas sp. Sm6012]MDQ7281796.1 hypothetical protein [Stenotrophomonas sp. Sm6012]HEL3181041.1 hypothetical protein [Stenotrophomonas maltophilia]
MNKIPVLIGSTLLALVVALPVGARPQGLLGGLSPQATDAECRQAFQQSSAARSCSLQYMVAVGANLCEFRAECLRDDGRTISATYSLPLSSLPSYRNCNGWLQQAPC